MAFSDRERGIDRRIARPGFLNGVAVSAGALLLHGTSRHALAGYRDRFGRITLADSGAGAYAYTGSAIDQAHRAVQELLERA